MKAEMDEGTNSDVKGKYEFHNYLSSRIYAI